MPVGARRQCRLFGAFAALLDFTNIILKLRSVLIQRQRLKMNVAVFGAVTVTEPTGGHC